MAAKNRVKVRLVFEDGTELSNWDAVSVRDKYTDPLGSYSFVATPPRARIAEYDDSLFKGTIVKLYFDDALQATIIITSKTTTIGDKGVTFEIACKTLLCTPYDASANPDAVKIYTADTSIRGVLLEVMKPYGFTTLLIEDVADVSLKTGKQLPTWGAAPATWRVEELKHKEAMPQPGETAYGYCSRICSRVGAILQISPDGALVLSRPVYDQGASYYLVQGQTSYDSDMMLNGITITDTNEGQFSEIVLIGEAPDVRGQKRTNPPVAFCTSDGTVGYTTAGPAESSVATVSKKRTEYRLWLESHPDSADKPFQNVPGIQMENTRARYNASGQAGYKPKIIVDKRTRDNDTAKRVALIAMGSRSVDAYQIKCQVDGAKAATGYTWAVNTVAHISIPLLGIDDDMWILERGLDVSRTGGQITTLTLIPKDSLLLDVAYA